MADLNLGPVFSFSGLLPGLGKRLGRWAGMCFANA